MNTMCVMNYLSKNGTGNRLVMLDTTMTPDGSVYFKMSCSLHADVPVKRGWEQRTDGSK